MKIKYPKKQEKRLGQSGITKWGVSTLLIIISFVGGMFFYRSGYASVFSAYFRNVDVTDKRISNIPNPLAEITEEINAEISLYEANGLATVFLDIPFSSMRTIEEKREEALETGILFSEDDDYVPGSIRYNDGESMDMQLRLKGDWSDHLESDKWSFRIQLKDGQGAILGMRRFSLQAPETRRFVNEWAYHQHLMSEGILTTRYHFVNVVLDGEYKGIYALEESFTEDLMESQQKREGIILRLNEDYLWSNWARFEKTGSAFIFNFARDEVGFFLNTSPDSTNVDAYRTSRINNNETLSAEAKTAIELLDGLRKGVLRSDEVLDEALWGKYYAISDLWGAGHATVWHNVRIYYNPITGLLEPVAYDGDALMNPNSSLAEVFSSGIFFDSPTVQKSYIENLYEIITDDYRARLKELFAKESLFYANLLASEYGEDKYPYIGDLWEDLDTRRGVLYRNLDPDEPIRGNYRLVTVGDENYLHIDLVNMMVVPVQVKLLLVDESQFSVDQAFCMNAVCEQNTVVDDEKVVLLSSAQSKYAPVSFDIPVTEADADLINNATDVQVDAMIYGGSKIFSIPLYSDYVPVGIEAGVKPSMDVAEALETHSFLEYVGNGEIIINAGEWDVDTDLVIPEGYYLSILEGTILRFAPDTLLLSEGAINIYGTEDAPVYLTAQNDTWAGVIVLNAPVESHWEYAVVEKTGGIARSGWILTGGVTFYESPIHIRNTVFSNNLTEDALNIVRTHFTFKNVEFANTPSDAFDGDFVSGSITNTSFHDIGGDAFDVSGSTVDVENAYFVRIEDKAVSAGEKSTLRLSNLTIRDVSIGIASKDLSEVVVSSSTIDNASVTGIAAYIKKEQYGAASVVASGFEILNTELEMICQTGSKILLNDRACEAVEIDIDSLYDAGILGN